eukprot:7738515-Pyramimonas_sp.AAC.1
MLNKWVKRVVLRLVLFDRGGHWAALEEDARCDMLPDVEATLKGRRDLEASSRVASTSGNML